MSKSYYRNLVIIGNGFDRWQGLPTSYDDFKEFYRNNIRSIVSELKIKTYENDKGDLITPVELIFGDIFQPKQLPDEFFWNLEESMALLDDQAIINHFPKSSKGLFQLQETIDAALDIIHTAFGKWIQSIKIEADTPIYDFGEDTFFISFNYTDTIEKRFGVKESNVYHIHGEASDAESIIVGHSTHPEAAFPELMEQKFSRNLLGGKGKSLRGLYLVEEALFSTDKHVQDNIDDLSEYIILSGINVEEFTDVYVLGHSLADVDYEYIEFLVKITQAGCDYNKLSSIWELSQLDFEKLNEETLLDLIELNISYAAMHRTLALGKEDIPFPREEAFEKSMFGRSGVYKDTRGIVYDKNDVIEEAREAVHKRFLFEQSIRTKEVMNEVYSFMGIDELSEDCMSILKIADYINKGHRKRNEDATWHISYFSEKDKKHIDSIMQRTGCKSYELHQGIEECISGFRI